MLGEDQGVEAVAGDAADHPGPAAGSLAGRLEDFEVVAQVGVLVVGVHRSLRGEGVVGGMGLASITQFASSAEDSKRNPGPAAEITEVLRNTFGSIRSTAAPGV